MVRERFSRNLLLTREAGKGGGEAAKRNQCNNKLCPLTAHNSTNNSGSRILLWGSVETRWDVSKVVGVQCGAVGNRPDTVGYFGIVGIR